MCFSEEASFTAAVGISVVAGASLQAAGLSRYIFLALTPLFFAIQQFSEGITWLNLKQELENGPLVKFAYSYFLGFAYVGWPIWVSLSLLAVEKVGWRKVILGCFLLGGLIVGMYNLKAITFEPVTATPVGHSISYNADIPYDEVWIYAAFTLLPWFFSSLRGVWLAAIVFVISFLAAGYFYEFTFASVWCFFAAIVSILIYKLIRDNITEEYPSRRF